MFDSLEKEIIVVGYAGQAKAVQLAQAHYDELKTRYRTDYLDSILSEYSRLPHIKEAAGTEGGVLKCLFDRAVASGCGMRIEIKKVPIMQSTIEITEYFRINPYRSLWEGLVRVCGEDEIEGIIKEYELMGITAAHIGCFTKCLDKLVIDKDPVEYINRS